MTKIRKILNIVIGVLMILCALAIIITPTSGFTIVAFILCISLIVYGIRELIFYFTMSRNMVGGKMALYIGIIFLDFGVFALTLFNNVNQIYIMIYMIICYLFSGVIDMLRAFEAKKFKAPSWKLNLISAFVKIALAVICGVFIISVETTAIIYSLGLIYSAVFRIVTAFRKTEIVYIQ